MIAIQATAQMAADKEAVGLSRVHMYESRCILPLPSWHLSVDYSPLAYNCVNTVVSNNIATTRWIETTTVIATSLDGLH